MFAFLLTAMFGTIALANDPVTHDSSRTTIAILNMLGTSAATDIATASHFQSGDSIGIHYTLSGNDAWISENAMTSSFRDHGFILFTNDTGAGVHRRYRLEVFSSEMNVHYSNMVRDGIFGTQKVSRTVSVSVNYQCTNAQTSEIVASGLMNKISTDTVLVDDIPSLESPGVKSTHGEIPSGQVLDKIVEPFIIIGTAGIVVYLFFHVRS